MKLRIVSIPRCLLCAFIIATLAIFCAAQEQAINLTLAEKYFREAEAASLRDGGRLWGVALYGPMMFVDRATRMVVTNRADAEGKLTARSNVFAGRLPDEINISNTATSWAGITWTMLRWPLSSDKHTRDGLMVHELFHRIQEKIGFPASNPSNNHLDSLEGRLWLQLEWRALRQALTHQGIEARNALSDAIVFRLHRQALFQGSASSERDLEMNEGLAEYTGVKLRGTTDAESVEYIVKQLQSFEQTKTFVRSFAYVTGPAYGLLLDKAGANWRKGLTPKDDFARLAQKLYSIKMPPDLRQKAEARALKYDGETLRASETERENRRRNRLADLRARLVDGPVLIIPLTQETSFSFDPNNLESLDGVGTVYPTMRVSGPWGILTVTRDALMILGEGVSKVHVPAPADASAQKIEATGWQLELKEGWRVEPDTRKGDYMIKKSAR